MSAAALRTSDHVVADEGVSESTGSRHPTTWVLVAGGFHQRGGMDKANYALAQYLAESGRPVHLVSHDVDNELQGKLLVKSTLVKRPFGSVFLGEFALDRAARAVKKRLSSKGRRVRVLANGSSCLVGDVNWVHYVHAAWQPESANEPLGVRVRNTLQRSTLCTRERIAFRRAKVILTNSSLTTKHVLSCLRGGEEKVSTIYLGADPLSPVSEGEKVEARERWNVPAGVPVVVFVGSFGVDSRKGFNVLLESWKVLCAKGGWDAQLLVAGDGPSLARYRRDVEGSAASQSIRFLGFSCEIGSLLAASDLLISPVRYEPYGLNIQEALCRGLAVLTSASAGIAERFPNEVSTLLLSDPESVEECIEKLLSWRANTSIWSDRFHGLGHELRQRSWHAMAKEIVSFVEAASEQA